VEEQTPYFPFIFRHHHWDFLYYRCTGTVNSLEHNIQTEIKSLGTNTIYIDKWDYSAGGGPDYPWWKFVKRPEPKFDEIKQIKERTPSAKYVAFNINAMTT
jgi:putative ABC transport system permease protein